MMPFAIVVDESADFEIVRVLRENGCEVYAVAESSPALADAAVLEIAVAKNALLITEDKDFGELVFRLQMPHRGILLLRMIGLNSSEKGSITSKVIQQYAAELKDVFSVLDERQLRIRR